MGQFANYNEYVSDEAGNFISEYRDDLLQEIKEGNTDVYEYVNDYRLHEWVDNDFIYVDLMDSAEIIEQSDNVETDWGLWEGQEPQDAIKTQAFFTYRNDLNHTVMEQLETTLNAKIEELESKLEELNDELGVEEDESNIDNIQDEIDELEEYIDYIEEAVDQI